MISILYVDDEPDLLDLAQIFLEQLGEFRVRTLTSPEGILGTPAIASFDAILSDYQMPGMDGIAFLKEIRKQSPDLPFILFTGRGREEIVIEALNNGADFYIQKGGDPRAQFAELANKIRYAVNRRRTELELRRKSDELNASYEQIAANEEELRQQLDELSAKQEALKISEEKFRAFTENVPDLTTITDVNGNYLYISPSIQRITGLDADALLGKKYAGVSSAFGIVPEDAEIILASGRSAIQKPGVPVTVPPFRVRDVQGQSVIIEGTITYLPEVKGIQGLLFHGRNITDRVRAEEEIAEKNKALMRSYEQLTASEEELRGQYEELAFGEKRIRENEENYRSLIEFAPVAIVVHRAGKNVYANPEAVRLVKAKSIEDIVGKDILTFVSPEHRGRTLDAAKMMTEENRPLPRQEQHIVAVDGEKLTVEVVAKPISFQGLPSIMVLMRDITKRKKVEEELFRSQQMLQIVLDTIPQRVFWKDKDSVFLGCNKTLAQDAGLSDPSELIGKTDYDNSFRETADLYRADDRRVMETGQGRINYEEPQVRPDGSKAWLRTSKVPLRDKEGHVVGVLGTYEDITEYKNNTEALRESEEKYRTLVESANEAIAIVQDWKIVFVNTRGAFLLGKPAQDLVGQPFLDNIWPDDREQMKTIHETRVAGKPVPETYDFRIIGVGGKPVWVSNSTAGISWRGKLAALSLMTDITERKFAEAALKESEETFRKVIEGAPEAIYIGVDDKFVYLNPAALRLFGVSSGEHLIGTPFIDRIHPRFHEEVSERVRQLYKGIGPAAPHEEVYLRLDGTEIEVEVTAVPFTYLGRNGGLVFVSDISERKRAARERKESEEKSRHILESMQDAYVRTDRDSRITMVNPAAVRMYGYASVEDMIGMPAAALYYSSTDRDTILRRLHEEKAVTDISGQGRKKDGTLFWTSLNIQYVYENDGSIAGVEGFIRDITERNVMEQAIQDTNKKLSLLNSITRHDVANQLTVLRGYAQLVELSNTDPVIIDFMQKIEKATDTITGQIEFTKAYQELGAHTPAWSRLEEILEKTARPEVSFSKTCLATEIFADPMIERVFFNLFDNAIRHGEHVTTIGIRCERAPDGLVIIVEDDGVGIAPEEKEKIFGKAYGKNTGFGLFLAREILAITGITIRETGYVGVGARFEITVPKEMWRTVAGQ